MKKHLTKQEEFEIMKLVLDKFLWIGVFILGLGFYKLVADTDSIAYGFLIMLAGIVVLLIFSIVIIKEYEFIKS
ncbi:MAG: hypothetical protein V1725_04005 [archaeon]